MKVHRWLIDQTTLEEVYDGIIDLEEEDIIEAIMDQHGKREILIGGGAAALFRLEEA